MSFSQMKRHLTHSPSPESVSEIHIGILLHFPCKTLVYTVLTMSHEMKNAVCDITWCSKLFGIWCVVTVKYHQHHNWA